MKHAAIVLSIYAAIMALVWWITRLPEPLFPDDYSTVVLDENGKYLRIFLNSDEQWCFPTPEKSDNELLPEKLKRCIIFFEDKRFYHHPGIDIFAIFRAFIQNLGAGEYVSGASTLTMQVARIAKPKKRTILNKAIETIQALKIDLYYSKEEILELYVAHAPYGGNIIGYKAACLRYWGKNPDRLTWAESAALAILPNSPSLINPVAGKDKLKKKRDRLLARLLDAGIIDKETYELSILEPLPERQIPFAISAPHLARNLDKKFPGKTITTTLSAEIQSTVENIVREYARNLYAVGIKNTAVLVVETESGKVKAYVGSQDFFDNNAGGKVDGVMSPRSYGSILKPFLYALAMDDAIIIPETKIKDIPTYYGAFSPYNADLKFNGLVTAHEALVRSLNVPAVRLLYTYGFHNFFDFLKEAGMTTLFRSAENYGLTLILGGAESNVWEIASLYRGLGNYGYFSGIYVVKDDSLNKGKQLISPGGAYLVMDILKDLRRPGAEYYWHMYSNQWLIAWKTGTSYGHRDAWAVGVSPQWVIAVWAGNFTGEGNPNIVGARAAGPLLFKIFNSLPKNPYEPWFDVSDLYIEKIKVCAETGFLAGPNCPHVVECDAPRTNKIFKPCPYHKKIFVTEDEKEQVCSMCWDIDDIKEVTRLVYPPQVMQYLREHGGSFQAIPSHRRTCPTLGSYNPIEFIYPKNGSHILVPKDISGEYQKVIVQVAHSRDESELYWYLDDEFIGSTIDRHSVEKHTIALDIVSGRHKLNVIDQDGYYKSIRFDAGKR